MACDQGALAARPAPAPGLLPRAGRGLTRKSSWQYTFSPTL